ncbi:flagellar assembly protein FliW [Desulforhopalus sp. IMCC35007]|uniref:flagellar assembly protein FliW n=1 Tax=Desulforhopalus sp. IMCC35007 TaxID=2569543 RepID=UPI0010AEC42F|nr:flagellar assembly protein FliW [Desulforhopalus sp. IMCC35007]TKB07164.1 flagellar assembly protein FliW [Desulforhopalus sp. IMCC35007]
MKRDADVKDSPSVNADKIVTFPHGIPGFEKYTTYVVYHKQENGVGAYWLESCDDPGITFTLVAPEQYGLSYELELSDEEAATLQADTVDDLGIFMVLSKKEDGRTGSSSLNANIRGPIIINPKKRLGIQKVIQRPRVNTMIMEGI